jgi:hypothetical protein
MKLSTHYVVISPSANPLPLENSATKIFSLLDIHKMKFIEKPLANQDYDFYWFANKDGVAYQLHGDRWEPAEPQMKLTVSLSGREALARARELVVAAGAAGWSAALMT